MDYLPSLEGLLVVGGFSLVAFAILLTAIIIGGINSGNW